MYYKHHLVRLAVVLLISSVALMACGNTQQATADTVHSQFVQALTANDRQAVLNLMAPEVRVGVDQFLNRIQNIMAGNDLPPRYAGKHGKFVGAEALPVMDQGKGKAGVSVWRWEQAIACYQVVLAQTEDGWKITEWWQATVEQRQQHTECQAK